MIVSFAAQPIKVDERRVTEITPASLRPPEVYLGAAWDEKVDIWSFGCLVRAMNIIGRYHV